MFTLKISKQHMMQNCRFHNFFNWTMTYRVDSDIYRPYGWVSELGSPSIFPPDPDSIRWRKPPERYSPARKRQKTKMVAWVVSNCNTHSNRYNWDQDDYRKNSNWWLFTERIMLNYSRSISMLMCLELVVTWNVVERRIITLKIVISC